MDNRVNQETISRRKWVFDDIYASTVDPNLATIISLGAGSSLSQSAGNLIINAGTTAYAETILRLLPDALEFDGILRYGLTLSQRIANNNFAVELVDVIGDKLPMTVTSTTNVNVNAPSHGFTSKDVGKGIWIGAMTVASCPSMRATIASVIDDNNIALTVSGFPASGSGTCSLFGFNNHTVIYNGVGTTSLGGGYSAGRNGWNNTAVNATINNPAGGHIGLIESCRQGDSTFSDAAFGSATGQQFLPRATMNQNVPDPGYPMVIQLRSYNGSAAPASNTVMTVSFVDVELFTAVPMRVAYTDAVSQKGALPVVITGGSNPQSSLVAVNGIGRGASNNGGAPLYVATGYSANPGAITTGRNVDLQATLIGALITKPFAIPESDWTVAAQASGIVNTTTAVTLKAAAGAGIRNYLTGLQINADPLGAATEVVIRDGASGTVIWRTKIQTSGLAPIFIDFPTPLRSTANTLLEVATLTASVTGGVYVNAQGYAAP